MHAPHHTNLLRSILLGSLIAGSQGLALPAVAQDDSAFLSCARFEDRGQRIACLEDALEAATTAAPGQTMVPAAAVAPAAAPSAPPSAAESAAAESDTATASTGERSVMERIRGFGQNKPATSISTDEDGQERLHDSIAALQKRNNLWVVTLGSGQVWRQTYPRTLLLREGDDVEIYREGIGSGYRLATPRLSGFIRVERMQ
jgi:hypothetical protein